MADNPRWIKPTVTVTPCGPVVLGGGEPTDEQRVRERWPGTYAIHELVGWLIVVNGYGAGRGWTEKAAWADAAGRLTTKGN